MAGRGRTKRKVRSLFPPGRIIGKQTRHLFRQESVIASSACISQNWGRSITLVD